MATSTAFKLSNKSGVGSDSPAQIGAVITPSDSTIYDPPLRGFECNGGDVAVVFANDPTGTAVTLSSRIASQTYAYSLSKVMATNTTATTIIGLA